MTDEATLEDKIRAAEWVGEAVRTLLGDIRAATGWTPDVILSGAHAMIVTELATVVGGRAAAAMAEQSADRVRDMPSLRAYSLAVATPAGRA